MAKVSIRLINRLGNRPEIGLGNEQIDGFYKFLIYRFKQLAEIIICSYTERRQHIGGAVDSGCDCFRKTTGAGSIR